MPYEDSDSSSISLLLNATNTFNYSTDPTEAVLIAFQIGRIISFLCIIFGILGNTALIIIIYRSSFLHFPYGLLLLFISTFDIIRLISIIIYYLIQANIIPLTLPTVTIYITLYRYPLMVTNWLKVILAIERFLAVKYWAANRYNINSNNSKRMNHSRQRKLFLIILIVLLCSLISQHPNLIPDRFISTSLDPAFLLIVNTPNPYFYYGNKIFNDSLFTIISYIMLDDLLPIAALIICNAFLLYELKHLPAITCKKLAESIFILFFLTVFSIFLVPRSFLAVFYLYGNQEYINKTVSITCHLFQGIEMINHAITGYACFLSSHSLRRSLIKNIRLISDKFQRKTN